MQASTCPTVSVRCCHTLEKSFSALGLSMDIVSTERDFKDVQLADRSRVHALKALVLMSKFGVTTVLTTSGGAGGTAAGNDAHPGPLA